VEGYRVGDPGSVDEGWLRGTGVDDHAVGVLLYYTVYLGRVVR
jgi:hypothetical protein